MRKALLPMLASLALCGGATAVLVITNAHAQAEKHYPMMVAQLAPGNGADAPRAGRPVLPMGRRPGAGEIAAHMKQMCEDRYARAAGAMAYTEAKLSLNPAQRPLFEQWKQVKLDIAKRRADACASLKPPRDGKMPTLVERMARQEDRLKKRLADLDAERPVLEAFYNALSPEQKREFGLSVLRERRFAGGPHGPGMMGHGPMGRAMMEHRMMGPGMMGPGMMGMGPPEPGDAPPGPPPQ